MVKVFMPPAWKEDELNCFATLTGCTFKVALAGAAFVTPWSVLIEPGPPGPEGIVLT